MKIKQALSSTPKVSQVKMAKGTKVKPKRKGLGQCVQNYFLTNISKQCHHPTQGTENITFTFLVICALDLPIQAVNIKIRSGK